VRVIAPASDGRVLLGRADCAIDMLAFGSAPTALLGAQTPCAGISAMAVSDDAVYVASGAAILRLQDGALMPFITLTESSVQMVAVGDYLVIKGATLRLFDRASAEELAFDRHSRLSEITIDAIFPADATSLFAVSLGELQRIHIDAWSITTLTPHPEQGAITFGVNFSLNAPVALAWLAKDRLLIADAYEPVLSLMTIPDAF
jgi:hypothetical protein